MATIGQVKKSPLRGYTIEWKIENFFSLLEEVDKIYSSPSFSFAGAYWCFKIFTTPYLSSRSIDLYLERLSSGPPISVEFSLGLKTLNGKEYLQEFTHVFDTEVMKYVAYDYLLRSMLLERRSVLAPLDAFIIIATMKYHESNEDTSNVAITRCSFCKKILDSENISSHQQKCLKKPIKCLKCSEVTLLKHWYDHECQAEGTEDESSTSESSMTLYKSKVFHDFKEIFLKKEDCDVLIKVRGQLFPAHKAILNARSPGFLSTFQNETITFQKKAATLDIEDFEPSTFSDFLLFLYCGDVRILSGENVYNLFTIAHKYGVPDLKTKCVEFMKNNLCVDSFCDTLTLALQNVVIELINLTQDFFTKNAPRIISTVKWQTFLAENPTKSNELLIKLLVPNKCSDNSF